MVDLTESIFLYLPKVFLRTRLFFHLFFFSLCADAGSEKESSVALLCFQ